MNKEKSLDEGISPDMGEAFKRIALRENAMTRTLSQGEVGELLTTDAVILRAFKYTVRSPSLDVTRKYPDFGVRSEISKDGVLIVSDVEEVKLRPIAPVKVEISERNERAGTLSWSSGDSDYSVTLWAFNPEYGLRDKGAPFIDAMP